VQGTYCGGWRRCACLDAETRVLAVGVLASTTCNNFIADLLFLSEVSHSRLVAGGPCTPPHLLGGMGPALGCLATSPPLDRATGAAVLPLGLGAIRGLKDKRTFFGVRAHGERRGATHITYGLLA
jgi:hypothetical protein